VVLRKKKGVVTAEEGSSIPSQKEGSGRGSENERRGEKDKRRQRKGAHGLERNGVRVN